MTTIEEYRARLREALVQIHEMEEELEASERKRSEPIAIIGMGCRIPGAENPEAFYQQLVRGVDCVGEVPPDRWPLKPLSADATYEERAVRWGAFLGDVSLFDPAFFGISPREAAAMDPQQRLLLEVSWEALEHAGCATRDLVGSATAVFVGLVGTDYRELGGDRDIRKLDIYDVTGNGHCFAAGRISYTLGLEGPCMTLDTACSSSLVAIHEACQSLRHDECNMALAGGVNLMLTPRSVGLLARTKSLSADGRSRAFDAAANGFVRGEGAAVVVLKRLSDARRAGDTVLGVILGSAVNQDGRSAGFAAPNVRAQEAVLRKALASAGVGPEDIDHVESHGTGTSLGDPIEFEALKTVFGHPRADGSKCVIGALKTHVGHLEAAAGVAGLMKVVLAMQHGTIPKNLHFKTLNPHIALGGTPFIIPKEPVPWPAREKRRRAGVSSFGMSGTNAHVILEEPSLEDARPPAKGGAVHLLPLSAKTPEALVALSRAYGEWLSRSNDIDLADIIYTASVRRMHHDHRVGAVGATREELAAGLAAFAAGAVPAGVATGRAPAQAAPKVVFVFPGQGSQWLGMGRQLLAEEPVFREALAACDLAIQRESGFSILEELVAEPERSRLGEIDVVQPLLFAVAVALARLWRSWGVEPDCVVGHSMGEVAAAHVAHMLSLSDAAKVICRRSRLLRTISGKGAMAFVELPMAEAEKAIAEHVDRLSVAVSNGPRSTVISGDSAALDEVLGALVERGVFVRLVKVDVASHSPQVEPLRAGLLSSLSDVVPAAGNIAMRSTVTGEALKGPELSASYWWDNLRLPVRFSQVTQALLKEGHTIFVEMAPHPVLLPSVEENLREAEVAGVAIASMRRQAGELRTILEALAALHVRGVPIDWAKRFPDGGRVAALPAYAWQRERYWIERPASREERARSLLGDGVAPALHSGLRVWEQSVSLAAFPYLEDHRVHGEIVFPGAGYVEMAFEAAASRGPRATYIERLSLERTLPLTEDGARVVQVSLVDEGDGSAALSIFSRAEGATEWERHVVGVVRDIEASSSASPTVEALGVIEERCSEVVPASVHYERMEERGVSFGPSFRGIERLRVGKNEVVASVRLPDEPDLDVGAYRVHPALLDACLQSAAWTMRSPRHRRGTWVPAKLSNVRLYAPIGRAALVHGRALDEESGGAPILSITVFDPAGRVLLEIGELHLSRFDTGVWRGKDPVDPLLFEITWRRKELPGPRAPTRAGAGAWLVFVDSKGLGRAMAARLRERGEECLEVSMAATFQHLGASSFCLDTTNQAHLRRLLEEAFGAHRSCKGIVHLQSLDAAPWPPTSAESLLADVRRSSLGALRLSQSLLVQGWRDVPRLFLVTRGVWPIESDVGPIAVSQAPLWGLARTIVLEHPALECTSIDLPPSSTEAEVERLVDELVARDVEDQVALRDNGRLVARLGRTTLDAAPPVDFVIRGEGTHLITGGLGGLGLVIAEWMVAKGAKHLVLLGRSEPSPRAREVIRALNDAGAVVRVERADVSNRAEITRVLSTIRREMPPLAGVVHAAAVLRDRTLLDLSEEAFLDVLGAKVVGALHLHELTAGDALDYFVLYSSAAALLGSPGQGNYAAANAFLDALARERDAEGLPAMSIAWGPITDVGLAAAQENRGKRLAGHGIQGLSPAEGNQVLEKLLSRPRAEVGVMRLSLREWQEAYPQAANMPLFGEVHDNVAVAGAGADRASSFRRSFEAAAADARFMLLQSHVLEQLARVLRTDASKLEATSTFTSLGVDSLMSLELRNRLQASLGLTLQATLLFTYPSVAKLVPFLLDALGGGRAEVEPAPTARLDPPARDDAEARRIEQMGIDDLVALLDEELSQNREGVS